MRVLIVGGTGLIGGTAATHLQSLGHQVTITGRRDTPPADIPSLKNINYIRGDFLTEGDFTKETLSEFEGVVFCAGPDARHVPPDQQAVADQHLLRVNGEALPAFARRAKDAGVEIFIHIGSLAPHMAPERIDTNAYVRSRKLASDGVVAFAAPTFHAISLDPGAVIGALPGLRVPHLQTYVQYAKGELTSEPPCAPEYSTNFMSTTSMAEAIAGALENARSLSGRAILLGDENLSWVAYLEMWFHALGKNIVLQAKKGDHPVLPRSVVVTGDKDVSYDMDPEDVKLLGGFRRGDVRNAVEDIVRDYTGEK